MDPEAHSPAAVDLPSTTQPHQEDHDEPVGSRQSSLFEPAVNVIYNFGTDDESNSMHPSRGSSVFMEGEHESRAGPAYYYYYGQKRSRDEGFANEDGSPRKSARLQGKKAPDPRLSVSPFAAAHRDLASEESVARILPSGATRPAVVPLVNDPCAVDTDEDEMIQPERELDGVPPNERSPYRVYKVPGALRSREVREPPPAASDPPPAPALPRQGRPRGKKQDNNTSSDYSTTSVSPSSDGSIESAPRQPVVKKVVERPRRIPHALIQAQPSEGLPAKAPPKLQAALPGLRADFPHETFDVGYCRLPEGDLRWGLRCFTCPEAPLLSGGNAGICEFTFRKHLQSGKHAKMRDGPAMGEKPAARGGAAGTSKSSTSTSGQNTVASGSSRKKASANMNDEGTKAVKEFLVSLGLLPELATILRKVGIMDRARLESLGKMSSAALDRIEKKLEDNGLDSTAIILVRDGLEKRAAAKT
ncbi:hypothetical protein C8Q78DRAFT_990038 [Trametes maxima]|nr:hypothetical protein C8Q78DRAFT_990038 [Trametes maxima]